MRIDPIGNMTTNWAVQVVKLLELIEESLKESRNIRPSIGGKCPTWCGRLKLLLSRAKKNNAQFAWEFQILGVFPRKF